jgi:hypothetical protein
VEVWGGRVGQGGRMMIGISGSYWVGRGGTGRRGV